MGWVIAMTLLCYASSSSSLSLLPFQHLSVIEVRALMLCHKWATLHISGVGRDFRDFRDFRLHSVIWSKKKKEKAMFVRRIFTPLLPLSSAHPTPFKCVWGLCSSWGSPSVRPSDGSTVAGQGPSRMEGGPEFKMSPTLSLEESIREFRNNHARVRQRRFDNNPSSPDSDEGRQTSAPLSSWKKFLKSLSRQ